MPPISSQNILDDAVGASLTCRDTRSFERQPNSISTGCGGLTFRRYSLSVAGHQGEACEAVPLEIFLLDLTSLLASVECVRKPTCAG